ncbi:MAG: ATP-binding protein, partial [Chloroflexi bacterium]|nr:ATP-binding protein [Chloroflexota bacterium]
CSPKKCRISVEDNGIGFPKESRERIFGFFQRLHGRNEYQGNGIGLAICRKIVANHAGTIHAESEQGQGSKFIVTLPAPSRVR